MMMIFDTAISLVKSMFGGGAYSVNDEEMAKDFSSLDAVYAAFGDAIAGKEADRAGVGEKAQPQGSAPLGQDDTVVLRTPKQWE